MTGKELEERRVVVRIEAENKRLRVALGRADATLHYIHVWSDDNNIVEEQALAGIKMIKAALKEGD